MERVFTVSETARKLGRSERWLREAEAKGKIPKARRDLNGWRVYTQEDVERLKDLLVPPLNEVQSRKLTPVCRGEPAMKKHTDRKEKRLKVTEIQCVPTPDADERFCRAMDILLKAAARGTTKSEDSPDADKEKPFGRSTHEATGNGGCKDGEKQDI
jgi:hypothetical protein